MKKLLPSVAIALALFSCEKPKTISSIDPVNWGNRMARVKTGDSLERGSTYLSVYSQIYSLSEHKTHDLTATISMRNTNRSDTIYIGRAEYFDTGGKLIRTYFDQPIYLAPMETVEIVIDEADREGGTGANFMFDWMVHPNANTPLFEGVMISTSGQQGLSFTTEGKRVK